MFNMEGMEKITFYETRISMAGVHGAHFRLLIGTSFPPRLSAAANPRTANHDNLWRGPQ